MASPDDNIEFNFTPVARPSMNGVSELLGPAPVDGPYLKLLNLLLPFKP